MGTGDGSGVDGETVGAGVAVGNSSMTVTVGGEDKGDGTAATAALGVVVCSVADGEGGMAIGDAGTVAAGAKVGVGSMSGR